MSRNPDNKVKSYTDSQLLTRCESVSGFKAFPKDYWILGVRSNEDSANLFDDKFYIFKGREFIMVTSGTTNPGKKALFGFQKYNPKGAAVIKSNQWYYDVWKVGLHRGAMKALRQVKNMLFYRDGDKDLRSEEVGPVYRGMIGLNFHTISYNRFTNLILKYIGGWSAGCQVANNVDDYYKIMKLVKKQKIVTYCLIKEF